MAGAPAEKNTLTWLIGELRTLPSSMSCLPSDVAHPQYKPLASYIEGKIKLAIQARKRDAPLSERRAAALYAVLPSTLGSRRGGANPRRDHEANGRKLSQEEELVIVERILDRFNAF